MNQPLNAMTIDVEDYFHVSAFSESIPRSEWNNRTLRVEKNIATLLELFDANDTQATFFVLGWLAEKVPSAIKEIHACGHEIASHGYSHELVYRQSQCKFHAETERSKKYLEDLTGEEIRGYRAASWSITRHSLWALDSLSELGFAYDSSIFPIYHDRYGIPNAPSHPYTIQTPSRATLVEFPPSIARVLGQNLPVAGGGYFRLYPYRLTRWLLNRVISKQQQPIMFYLHPWEIDEDQPRISAGRLSTFRHYNNLSNTLGRLKQLLADFEFTTARSALDNYRLPPASFDTECYNV